MSERPTAQSTPDTGLTVRGALWTVALLAGTAGFVFAVAFAATAVRHAYRSAADRVAARAESGAPEAKLTLRDSCEALGYERPPEPLGSRVTP